MDGKRNDWAAAAALGFGLVLSSALPAAAQMMQPKTSPPPQAPQPTLESAQPQAQPQTQAQSTEKKAPAEQPPANKEEDDAYKNILVLTSQQNAEAISLGEDFLAKYPASRYRSAVYFRVVGAYLNSNQAAKVVSSGEKAIAENPDNVDVLALVCTVIPRTVDSRSLDADQKLSEAEKYARHAIELANSMPKPEGITDEQFGAAKNERLGLAHYGLGLVDYMRGNSAGSVQELDQASKLDPAPEPLLFYLLGKGDMKLQKFPDAAAAFDRCAKAQWDPQWQGRCKQGEQEAKQAAGAPAPAKP
jgi:tetratricopeptide (TPR) repeat protein